MESEGRRRIGSSEVTASLRREIMSGHLMQGDRLPPERALSERFGVARGTVREALGRLAREGLVEIRPGSGAYVRSSAVGAVNPVIDNTGPLELIDTRFALEPHICRLAVLHARREDLDRYEALLGQMEESEGNPERFSDADTEFHTLLAQSTGNGLLIWIVGQISSVRGRDQWYRMRTLTLDREMIAAYNRQHREIVAAIREREPERAAEAMKRHLETARLSLTRAAST
ncbi:GntR family transcriptional regulator [Paralimibaculum aggregatum]|uniref:GntR family transcriptional regulator n=1 Tax=Paralimibaculum aggregatum TaxID=3036245 RepID=A0ABQ6LNM2_9RHOB|nr:FadR/GntR family transcriptional regulator [Limibaculum sp. NKW23]GMG84597.1 GntR family transcriptional regulator [Limibaculum sp. NKW23]